MPFLSTLQRSSNSRQEKDLLDLLQT